MTDVETEPQTEVVAEPQTEAQTEPEAEHQTEPETAPAAPPADPVPEQNPPEEKPPLTDIMSPVYWSYDEAMERYVSYVSENNSGDGLNQVGTQYTLLVPVVTNPDYKLRMISGGGSVFSYEFMPSHLDDPRHLEVYGERIIVEVHQAILDHDDFVEKLLADPDAVWSDKEIRSARLIFYRFENNEIADSDYYLKDYFTFELMTYTITSESGAVQ